MGPQRVEQSGQAVEVQKNHRHDQHDVRRREADAQPSTCSSCSRWLADLQQDRRIIRTDRRADDGP